RAAETGVSVANLAVALEVAGAQPSVRALEASAAVIALRDEDGLRNAVDLDDARMGDGVRNPCERLGEVQRRALAVADAEEQHLPVEIVHAADGALGTVGRRERLRGADALGERPLGGE